MASPLIPNQLLPIAQVGPAIISSDVEVIPIQAELSWYADIKDRSEAVVGAPPNIPTKTPPPEVCPIPGSDAERRFRSLVPLS